MALPLSVIVPCFNENTNIPVVLEDIVHTFQPVLGNEFELIVVNDGSTDKSADYILSYQKERWPNLIIINHATNRGFGNAIRSGFSVAQGDFMAFLPSDGEIGADQLLKIFNMRQNMDLVVTARERNEIYSFYRSVLSFGFHLTLRLVIGFSYRGMEGIYLIRREVYQKLKFSGDSKLINMEIPFRCVETRCKIARTTMACRPRLSGESKIAGRNSVLKEIFLTFKCLWRLKYRS